MAEAAQDTTPFPQHLHVTLERIALEQGFARGQFSVRVETGATGKHDGFVGIMLRAVIQQGTRQLTVLCKVPPDSEARRQQMNSLKMFKKEQQAYNDLLPVMFEFQREKGVAEQDGFFGVPKCFLAVHDEAKEEYLITMEDLRLRGFGMWNKMLPMDYNHVKLVMVQLGRLHALSFALKHQRPEVFERFKQQSDMMAYNLKKLPGIKDLVQLMVDKAIGALQPHEQEARSRMENVKENYLTMQAKCSDATLAEPYAVLNHGDCWINNLMFRYAGSNPEELILIDWQIIRYMSPATDLSHFLLCCTDEDFRRQHYKEMLQIYHKSLSELLRRLGGDPERQFPYSALQEQLKKFGIFGVLMACFVVPALCTDSEDLPDLDEQAEKFAKDGKITSMNFAEKEDASVKFNKRMSPIIRDAIRFGYL